MEFGWEIKLRLVIIKKATLSEVAASSPERQSENFKKQPFGQSADTEEPGRAPTPP